MTSTFVNPYSEGVDCIHDLDRCVGSERYDENVDSIFYNEQCHKRHGLLCRILTRLHLKQKTHDREKLISEDNASEAELKVQPRTGSKRTKKTKHGKYEAQIDEEKTDLLAPREFKRKRNFSSIFGDKTDCVNDNEKSEIPLSSAKYSSFQNEEDVEISSKIPPNEKTTVDITAEQSISKEPNLHVYSDVHFGEVFLSEQDASPLLEKKAKGNISTGEYVKHQWKGKRAKKARKRIRRVMKATWASLQTGININYIPNTNNLVQVLATKSSKHV